MNKEASIHQPNSLKKLETKFKSLTEGLHIIRQPCALGLNLMMPKENEELIDDKKQHDYRSGVRMLLYLAKQTRPDIANAVHEHSNMMDVATELYYKSLLWLIKYVLDTKEYTLKMKLKMNGNNLMNIEGYCDSDYAGDKDSRRSVTRL